VDQNPIGKSSRSNPVTYIKAWDDIRKLYSDLKQSKIMNMKASAFSFNVPGGRCEECQGAGEITVEMQFMADVTLICEACHGKRFKDEVLEIKYRGKNISDILEMTVNEAIDFFDCKEAICNRIKNKLLPLQRVGLGYIKLGQSSSTLSGGESQRVKLASFLIRGNSEAPRLFIFDEPTTGLHFHDIKKLLRSFTELINNGHSILVVEHNLEIIKNADWIIELGPEGGDKGGQVIFYGTPEQMVKESNCETAYMLKKVL
jgi:excinuclease ABC subunit A